MKHHLPLNQLLILIILLTILTGPIPAAEIIPMPGLIGVADMVVEGDELFVTHNYTVDVYSIKSKKILSSFAEKGSRFGQLKAPVSRIMVFPNHIFIDTVGQDKVAWFSRKGKIKNEKIKPSDITLLPVYSKFAGAVTVTRLVKRKRVNSSVISIYDDKLNPIKQIYEIRDDFNMLLPSGSNANVEYKMLLHHAGFDCDTSSGKIFV